jgi:hypothetical protein
MSFLGGLFGGGPSPQMKFTSAQEQSLADTLMANYSQLYGEQQDVFSKLNAAYSPIIAAGPGQQGFTSPVLAALNTQAINSASAANRNARQSVADYGAGRGNSSGLVSGVQKQLQGEVASASANQLATAQNAITQANYNLGRQNYYTALGGLSSLGGLENPVNTGALASNELTDTFNSATKINDETNAQRAALAGGLVGLGIDAATFGAGGIANLGAGESFGEGVGDFFQGGMSALGKQNG